MESRLLVIEQRCSTGTSGAAAGAIGSADGAIGAGDGAIGAGGHWWSLHQ